MGHFHSVKCHIGDPVADRIGHHPVHNMVLSGGNVPKWPFNACVERAQWTHVPTSMVLHALLLDILPDGGNGNA